MDRCDNEALLSKSLDGELTAEEQSRLDAHLQECARCRELLRDLKAVEQGLRSVPLPSAADWQERWQAVARALTTKQEERREAPSKVEAIHLGPSRWLFGSRTRWVLSAAACVLALLVGVLVLRSLLPGLSMVELASADSLEVEIEQGEGEEPGALLVVSAYGDVAVVWVANGGAGQSLPGI